MATRLTVEKAQQRQQVQQQTRLTVAAATQKQEQAARVKALPNLSLQAAKAGLQTGSTPISGAAVDRFFPSAVPSLRDEDALRAEVRTRSGSPAPLPTARPSAGLMLPTGAALQQERAKPRKLVTLPATFDVSPAGERDNSTAFDIDPATVGTRAEYVPGPTGLARLGLGLKSIGQGIAGTPGVIYETGKQMLVDTAENQANLKSARTDARAQEIRDELSQLAGQMDYIERYKYPTRKAGRSSQEYQELMAQRERLLDELGTAPVRTPVDMSAPGMKLYGEAIKTREEALEGLTGADRWLGEQAISIGQNLALLPTAAIHPAIPLSAMGAMAGADKMYELSQRGEPADEAFARGVVSGAIEAATEKIPLDTLMDVVKTGGRSALKNLLKQAGVEAGEESLSYVMNYIADKAARDPNASFSLAELANSAAGGAFSGFVLGGLGTAANRFQPLPMFDLRQVETFPEVQKPTVEPLPDVGGPVAPSAAQGGANVRSGTVDTPAPQQAQKTASTGEAGSTAVNTDPTRHTPQEQAVINEYQNAVDASLVAFVNKWKTLKNPDYKKRIRMPIAEVSERAAHDVQSATGIDVTGFEHVLSGNALEHIEKRHGASGRADQSMTDVNDIGRMGYVLENYDSVDLLKNDDGMPRTSTEYANADDTPAPMVQFQKKVNGTYYVVEAVPDSAAHQMRVVSAYMHKNGGSTDQVLNVPQNGPQLTPKAPHGANTSAVAPIIADSSAGGNTQSAQVGPESSVGAAQAGFSTSGMEGRERVSRMADSMPYDKQQEYATALSKEDYDKLFRYTSQTEAKSASLAEELLYYEKDGQRTFLKDLDGAAYQGITDSLREATAWNGPQTDAAHMIQSELLRRSVSGTITSEEYVDWLKTMREHETATGQGVQANSKWVREYSDGGSRTELDAWERLQESRLPEQEKKARFQKIVQWDQQIEAARNEQSLKDIILRVAEERGTLNNLRGKRSWALSKLAENSLNALNFEQLKNFAYASTSALSTDTSPSDIGQKIKAVQVLNMLSSPKTALRNLVGNTSFYGIDALAMNGAALLDTAVSKVTGTRSVAAQGPGMDGLRNGVQAMRMAIAEITMDVDMGSDQSRYGTSAKRTFKASGNLVERVLSALERNQGYLLNATDEFYKGMARSTAKATQKLVDSGKIRTDNANYASEQANQLAKYRTFQDDSRLSVAIQTIHDVLNLAGIGDSGKTIKGKTVHTFGAGDIAAPFTRVAGNLASRGLEYSPLNAARGAVELTSEIVRAKAGKRTVSTQTQARGVSDMARGMTGTVIAYGFMQLARAGLIRRADDEDDEDVRALNAAEGITGAQFNLSAAQRALAGQGTEWWRGDTLVDLASVEPLNLLMDLGILLASEDTDSALEASMDAFLTATSELPLMQFTGNVATDVIRYGQDPKEVLASETARTAASSLIPNALRGLAKGLDDRPRSVYTSGTLPGGIVDNVKNSLPILRGTLPGAVDNFGRDKLYQGGGTANLFNSLLNPVGVNTYNRSDAASTLDRVRDTTGDASFYPHKSAPKSISQDGQTWTLTYDDRMRHQRVMGQTDEAMVNELAELRAFQMLTAEEQASVLGLVREYAQYRANADVVSEYETPKYVDLAQSAQEELGLYEAEYLLLCEKYGKGVMNGDGIREAYQNGIALDDYLTYAGALKAVKADKEAKTGKAPGSTSQVDSARALLRDSSLTDKERAVLWSLEGDVGSEGGWKESNNPFGERAIAIRKQFDLDVETFLDALEIYRGNGKAADKKAALRELVGDQGNALYNQLGKD